MTSGLEVQMNFQVSDGIPMVSRECVVANVVTPAIDCKSWENVSFTLSTLVEIISHYSHV